MALRYIWQQFAGASQQVSDTQEVCTNKASRPLTHLLPASFIYRFLRHLKAVLDCF